MFDDLDARQVLDPFEQRGCGSLVDVLGDRHRQERAVEAAVEPTLHLLDRDPDPTRHPTEDLGAACLATDDLPVDPYGQHTFVVSNDATIRIENAAPLRQQRHRAALRLVDLFLKTLLLDGLQKPEPGADKPEQHRADERQDSEARGPLVYCHRTILPVTQPSYVAVAAKLFRSTLVPARSIRCHELADTIAPKEQRSG